MPGFKSELEKKWNVLSAGRSIAEMSTPLLIQIRVAIDAKDQPVPEELTYLLKYQQRRDLITPE
jgi:hypothetical protein